MIKVNIKHESYKYRPTIEEKSTIEDLVNNLLEPIMLDCMTYKAEVNAIKTSSGNFKITPKCDQYSTLVAMQSLLPEVIPSFD